MKFGRRLEEHEQPEWRHHYIPYRALKKQLECIAAGDQSDAKAAAELWRLELGKEALHAGDFVDHGLVGLEVQLHDLEQTAAGIRKRPSSELMDTEDFEAEASPTTTTVNAVKERFFELQVLAAIGRTAESVQRFRRFAELNQAALYKILKKHDKLLKSDVGLGNGGGLFKELVKRSRLAETGRMDALEANFKRLSTQGPKAHGLVSSPEVLQLVAGIGWGGHGHHGSQPSTSVARNHALLLGFFMGSSTALFACIGILLALPVEAPATFSMAYFLTPMPVFRVVCSVMLSLWCMGAVAWVCDRHDINHLFILNLDPRCRVGPSFFFSRAAALTTAWVLIFGMYVVDYKWEFVPLVSGDSGYNHHVRFHYVFYPWALLAVTAIGFLWPSRVCRNRYKMSVFQSVCRTAAAPLYAVDFADNIMGDVLTSLAKPLQDVPAACCYLMSPHPQPYDFVARFKEKGDTCSHNTHHVLLPFIAGLPYLFRALQCLRRFRDTREARHLWNFGKYLSSLLVVVVSSVFHNDTESIVLVSTLATIYACIWDITIDWGLDQQQFCNMRCTCMSDSCVDWYRRCFWHCKRRCNATRNFEKSTRVTSDYHLIDGEASGGKPARAKRPHRHFASHVYWCCTIIDVLARFAWVLTLIPTTILTGSMVGQVLLVSVISSIEVLRRSMWAVLRIEYEQVANASGFRALLWVPSTLNQPCCARGGP